MEQSLQIFANTVEPFIFAARLQPFQIGFTVDKINLVGGLTYQDTTTSSELTKKVFSFYKRIYNIDLPADTKIVFGIGSTQIINAFFYAIQYLRQEQKTTISFNTETKPQFAFIEGIANITKNCEFVNKNGDVEVVVTPNNPNGELFQYQKKLESGFVMFDTYYDNPIYTGQFKPSSPAVYEIFEKNENSVVINSFSGFGIAGTRCGFALIRNTNIAKNMESFIKYNSISNPSNISVANIAIEKYFLQKTFYGGPYNRLQKRIEDFKIAAAKNNITILNKTSYAPYIYNNKSAQYWLQQFNVVVAPGTDFNDTESNSRLSLMIPQVEWDNLLGRMIP